MAGRLATVGASTPDLRRAAPVAAGAATSRDRWPTAARLALAGTLYLGCSAAAWWHVWRAPTATATSTGGDPALFLWYLEWPAHALAHGLNPFFSTAMFHPGGVNLLANTSVLALGIPLAPLSWAFGPVLTLNVALTLGPALSALAMFVLACRWVRWAPAAFAGGLLYGFSPFVLNESAVGHLMLTWLVVPPLVVACLDALVTGSRRSAVQLGLVLGALAFVQFFLSTEVLVLLAVTAAIGLVLIVAWGALFDGAPPAGRRRRVGVGLGVGAVTGAVLLAYPAWYALAGPAHYVGAVWPGLRDSGGAPAGLFDGSTRLSFATRAFVQLGGYFGHPLPSETYVGVGVVAVLGLASLLWWRDRRLWLFWALALTSGLLTLGQRQVSWAPWGVVARLPLADDVIPQRFIVFTYLALATILALVIDHARVAVRGGGARTGASVLGAAAGVALGAAAVAQMAVLFVPELPYAVGPVAVPSWYAAVAPALAPGQVLLGYPTASSGFQNVLAWQAINRMHYSIASGGGPQGTAAYARTGAAGFATIADLSFGYAAPPAPTAALLHATRRALGDWGVTRIVIALDAVQKGLVRPHDPRYAVAYFTAVTGELPTLSHRAWVFTVTPGVQPLRIAPAAVAACSTVGAPSDPALARCVLRAAGVSGTAGP